MRRSLNFAFIVTIAVALLSGTAPAKSGFFQDFWGVVNDPIGLQRTSRELAQVVDRTLAGVREIESQTNRDLRDRINQIRDIVREVLDAADKQVANLDQIVQKALVAMQAIERQTYQDAVDLIYRAQCAAHVAVTESLRQGLAGMIGDLIEANPRITILGIKVVGTTIKKVEIVDPDLAYGSTKRVYLEQLRNIKETDPAYLILSKYQNISRFATFARCHYIDQGLALRFMEEKAEFEALSVPWLTVVKPIL